MGGPQRLVASALTSRFLREPPPGAGERQEERTEPEVYILYFCLRRRSLWLRANRREVKLSNSKHSIVIISYVPVIGNYLPVHDPEQTSTKISIYGYWLRW